MLPPFNVRDIDALTAAALANARSGQWVGYLDRGTEIRDLPCGCLQLAQGQTLLCAQHGNARRVA